MTSTLKFGRFAICSCLWAGLPPFLLGQADLVKETSSGDHLIRIYRSAEHWSGHGDKKSDWYTMSTPPAPTGYRLWSQSFQLVGDRNCAGGDLIIIDPSIFGSGTTSWAQNPGVIKAPWSECALKTRSDETVVWMFRMQGHSETAPLSIENFKCCDGGVSMSFRREGTAATSVGVMTINYERISTPK